jgi:hypothetical protein
LAVDRRRARGAAPRLGTAVSLWGAVNDWVIILADPEAFTDVLHPAAVGENVGTALVVPHVLVLGAAGGL